MTLTLTVTDLATAGAAFAGVAVYVWHCSSGGFGAGGGRPPGGGVVALRALRPVADAARTGVSRSSRR